MVVKKKKGFMLTLPALPWLIIIVFAIIVVVALLAIVKTASLISADSNRVSSNVLQVMLDSNDCTPFTKLPLKDVLAIGIAEGKTGAYDTLKIEYGGKTDDVKPKKCVTDALSQLFIKYYATDKHSIEYNFYVEHPTLCPPSLLSGLGCYGETSIGGTDFNVESSEYIALPNGDIARVVLQSP